MSIFYVRRRFETPNLFIVPSLTSAQHRFVFEGATVSVRLPHASEANPDDEVADLQATGWLTETREPTEYLVRTAHVLVTPTDPVTLATQLAAAPAKVGKPIAAGMPGTEALNEILTSLGSLAEHAMEHWLRIVQWRTDSWSIGRPSRGPRSVSSTSLFREIDDQILASASTRINVYGRNPVTFDEWADVQRALSTGASSPLPYQLFFDGQQHLFEDDFRRAVLDFAMACEILIRMLVEQHTPADLFETGKRFLAQAPAKVLRTAFLKDLLGPTWFQKNKALRKRLGKLFDMRNEIAHGHRPPALTRPQCVEFLKTTDALLAAGMPR